MDSASASASASASLPSSYSVPNWKYHVFISFRREDTGNSFTSFLHDALRREKIVTYIDEEDIGREDEISEALMRAIEESMISVVVFSENYANSSWCLDELVHILKCKRDYRSQVVPVFYMVYPADVRYHRGSYAIGFKQLLKHSNEKVKSWMAALSEAANLAGWGLLDTSVNGSKLAEKIVEDILKKLNDMSPSYEHEYLKGLFGIEKHIKQTESMLDIGTQEVRILGIWGVGGIGKTTLARVLFNKFAHLFEGRCFLSNVREKSKNPDDLRALKVKLFSKLLNGKDLDPDSTFERKRLSGKNVFVVLDDVSHVTQLRVLGGDHGDSFGPGSRIIVTTRDKRALIHQANDVYKLDGLNRDDALRLFHWQAFKETSPTPDFNELSEQVVDYAVGNPLALKISGSFFRRKIEVWKILLAILKGSSIEDEGSIQKILKISYDRLRKDEKNSFLDIACFFNRMEKAVVETLLGAFLPRDVFKKTYNYLKISDIGYLPKGFDYLPNNLKYLEWKNYPFNSREEFTSRDIKCAPPNELRSDLQKLLSSLFEEHRARNYTFSSIFPVKAILPRFTNQCVGNNVFCCLPEGLYDDNSWVGFALYVVSTRHPSASLKNLDSIVQHPVLTVEMEISDYKIFNTEAVFEEDYLFGLPNLVLLYIPRVAFSEILKTSCSISSSFSTTIQDEVEIELCGIRLVYEQDLKQIIQTVIECTLQSPQVYHQRYYQNFADIQNGETSTNLCSARCQSKQVPEQSSNSHRGTLKEHLLREYYQSFHRRSTYSSCFPQTEIPEWFKWHSNDGPSVKIQLPSNLHDDSNWIGLALWASFSTNELPASIFDNWDSSSPRYHLICNLETNGGRLEPLNVYQTTKEELKWIYFGGLIWLRYLPRESCFDLGNQCEFLEASFGSELPELWAHKCALRLVYEKDEIEFENTVRHCSNISTDNWVLIPDSFTTGTSQHLTPILVRLTIMAETPVKRIDKATQWQRNLKNLLQHFFRFNLTAILTIEGHIISTFGGFVPDRWYDFCFPHKAILEWFQHQSCSSCLKMPLPQKDLCNDRNWAGIVVCASFQVHEHPTVTLEYFGSRIFVSLLCHFKIQDRTLVSPPFQISKEKFKWFYKRGFIWMRYMPRHWCADILNEATSVEVSFHCPDCPSLTVEKCGIRLLYQHEVEEFKQQTIIEYTTSFFDDLTPIRYYIEDENEKKYGGTSGNDNSHNSKSREMLDFHRDIRYNSCYPHLDTDWFSHSNSGPSVTIQHLRPYLERDDNWIGLALFACFSNLDDPQPITFVDHHLISQLQTERGSLEPFFYQTDHEEFKWLNHGGQFFWLSYIPKKWFSGNLNQCSSLEASFVSDNQSLCVKMCGLHLVYRHDQDDFRQTILAACVASLFINQGRPNDSKDKGKRIIE